MATYQIDYDKWCDAFCKVDSNVPLTIAYKCATMLSEKAIRVEDTDGELLLKAAWAQFFKEAQIHDESVNDYARIFFEQHMSFDLLDMIDLRCLCDMGIVVDGDCQSIIKTAQKFSENPITVSTNSSLTISERKFLFSNQFAIADHHENHSKEKNSHSGTQTLEQNKNELSSESERRDIPSIGCRLDDHCSTASINGVQISQKSKKSMMQPCSEAHADYVYTDFQLDYDAYDIDTSFPRDQYEITFPTPHILLGEGISGEVYLCHVQKFGQDGWTSRKAAITCVEVLKDREGLLNDLQREAQILFYLNQRGVSCVPKLLYAGMSESNYILAIELVQGGKHMKLAELEDQDYIKCFSEARYELHMAGVFHNDIRDANVFFTPGGSSFGPRCTIIDFGMSKFIREPALLHQPECTSCLGNKYVNTEDETLDFVNLELLLDDDDEITLMKGLSNFEKIHKNALSYFSDDFKADIFNASQDYDYVFSYNNNKGCEKNKNGQDKIENINSN